MGEGGRRGIRRKKIGLRDDDDDDDDNDGNDNSNKIFRIFYRNSLLRNRDKKCYFFFI